MEYFIDTNFLIHYYFSGNLEWPEIMSDNNIILHIPRVVQQEIDKHKNDGSNSIRAKKARKISQIFKEMLDSVDLSYSQKVGRANVILRFFKNYTLEELKPYSQGLDLTVHDDIILASLKKYITDEKKSNCHFLSEDTGALTSAKACHIPYTRIPDSWQPPIPEDKEFEKNEPQIEIGFTFNGEKIFNPISDITLSVFRLPEEEIKTIANMYSEHNPPADDGEDYSSVQLLKLTNPLHRYRPPTETEVAEYKERSAEYKVKSLVYTCEEFRRQIKPEVFDSYFYLDLNEDNKLVFKITVSGKNMKNPVLRIFEIYVAVNYKPYYDDMLSLLGIHKEPSHAQA
jgi:predicted nucleic acid-binding protein